MTVSANVKFLYSIGPFRRSESNMKLYRYRSMNSKNLSRTFTHCEVYFSSPTQFNDPFDCKPPFSITAYTRNDLQYHYREAFRLNCSGLSDSQFEAMIEKAVASIYENDTFESLVAIPFLDTNIDVNSELGVLCLTEVPDDILMWSHYADGHRGIAFQFDKARLESAFGYCRKVDYKNNIIELKDITGTSPNELANLLLLKKAGRWEYEKEWRIIVDPGFNDIPGCRIYPFPKEALSGVIFGCEMRPEDKYAVNVWLKEGEHQAQVYQAIRDISSYSVRIDPPLD